MRTRRPWLQAGFRTLGITSAGYAGKDTAGAAKKEPQTMQLSCFDCSR